MFQLPKLNSQAGIVQVVLLLLLVGGVLAGTYLVQQRTNLLPKAQEPNKIVIPYIVYPSDKQSIPQYTSEVKNALISVQNFYKEKAGVTFNFAEPKIVFTQENNETLRCGSDKTCLSNPKALNDEGSRVFEACNKATGPTQPQTIKLIFCAGTGGYASGANNITFGNAMVGDWVLEPISGKANPWGINCAIDANSKPFCNRNAALGTIVHELGHSFGLPHPDNDLNKDSSVMMNHTAYPSVGFLPQEVQQLQNSPFLQNVTSSTGTQQTSTAQCTKKTCAYSQADGKCYAGVCKDPKNCGFNKGCEPDPDGVCSNQEIDCKTASSYGTETASSEGIKLPIPFGFINLGIPDKLDDLKSQSQTAFKNYDIYKQILAGLKEKGIDTSRAQSLIDQGQAQTNACIKQ